MQMKGSFLYDAFRLSHLPIHTYAQATTGIMVNPTQKRPFYRTTHAVIEGSPVTGVSSKLT